MLTRMPAPTSSRTTSAERGKRPAGRAADVDDVGTGGAEARRPRRRSLAARQPRRVVDLGQDLDVVVAVVPRGRDAAEVRGDLAQILGPLLHRHADRVGERAGRPRTGRESARGRSPAGTVERAPDPLRGHQRRHRDLQHRDVVGERRRHVGQHTPQRRLGERAGDERARACGSVSRAAGAAPSLISGGRRPAPTCPGRAAQRAALAPDATARPPRSAAPARSPCR